MAFYLLRLQVKQAQKSDICGVILQGTRCAWKRGDGKGARPSKQGPMVYEL